METSETANPPYNSKNYAYTLGYPITDKNGHVIAEVNCRRPTIGDSIANEENCKNFGPTKTTLYYFSMLTGINPDSLKRMDVGDWLAFVEGSNSFLDSKGTMQRLSEEL